MKLTLINTDITKIINLNTCSLVLVLKNKAVRSESVNSLNNDKLISISLFQLKNNLNVSFRFFSLIDGYDGFVF